MNYLTGFMGLAMLILSHGDAFGQMNLSGRVWSPRTPLSAGDAPPNTGIAEDYFGAGRRPMPDDIMAVPNVRCYASPLRADAESLAFMTWSTEPAGWYRFFGPDGDYTLLFTGMDIPFRPVIVTNVHADPNDKLDLKISPRFDYYVLNDKAYDRTKANEYFQTFVARGKCVTQVSFRFAHDGLDGIGPASQTVLVSIHRKTSGPPEEWTQIGPTMPVLNVDAGGPKNYDWTAAWNSGEVPVTPGEMYAVHLKPEAKEGTFQAFWRADEKDEIPGDCYRIGSAGSSGWQHHDLFMTVSTDGDGLLIPYNKRVQKQFGPFAGSARRWTQTYVAQGRSLAGVLLFAATGTAQPGMYRQRVRFRIHEGGPDGPLVGVEKIGIGTGIYTGDASWGTFGAAFAPGQVPLQAGHTYAIEVESMENYESLHGYVNIKNVASDERPSFNPYRKIEPDIYEQGTAYKNGTQDVGFDLDMQVIEYEYASRADQSAGVADWTHRLVEKNLLANGDMQSGELDPANPLAGKPEGWTRFELVAGGLSEYLTEGPENKNRLLRVALPTNRNVAENRNDHRSTFDAGYVQRVELPGRTQTYQLSGRVRASSVLDPQHACLIGIDLTGQIDDPRAATIKWTAFPRLHSTWTGYSSDPIRPSTNAISVWLRGTTKVRDDVPFKADFDDFSLRQIRSDVPTSND